MELLLGKRVTITRPTRLSALATYEPFGLATPTRGNAVFTGTKVYACDTRQAYASTTAYENLFAAEKRRVKLGSPSTTCLL